MRNRLLSAVFFAALAAFAGEQLGAQSQPAGLRIVVIAGEGAVNIIQQKTAVAPIVEVRDHNDVPVAGASVTFRVGGQGATFGSSGSTLTVTTNGAGQATAAGFTPTAAGTVQINVTATFQGLTAAATTIMQTVFATAAQAAAAGAGAGTAGAGSAGAAGAGAGGGISATTVAIVGAAAAGGAVAATQTGLIGGGDAQGFIMIKGRVYSTVHGGGSVPGCTGTASGTTPPGSSPPQCYGPPVSGAVVSTSLDSNTATTNGAGDFDLTTTIPRSQIEECRTYTLSIAASGFPTYSVSIRGFSGNRQGNEHRQEFSLSPPSPTFISGC